MKITAEPRSDQWNAEDFIGGPRTFTVAGVRVGTAEQKYDIGLEGEQRVWRPPLTVLRVLIKCWGDEAEAWTGRRVTLYTDPSVRFGKDEVGGVRVSHLSHIDGPQTISVTATRGKRTKVTVQPLPEAPAPSAPIDWDVHIADAAGDVDTLRAMWSDAKARGADTDVLDKIKDAATRAAQNEENA